MSEICTQDRGLTCIFKQFLIRNVTSTHTRKERKNSNNFQAFPSPEHKTGSGRNLF